MQDQGGIRIVVKQAIRRYQGSNPGRVTKLHLFLLKYNKEKTINKWKPDGYWSKIQQDTLNTWQCSSNYLPSWMASTEICDHSCKYNPLKKTFCPQNSKRNMLHQRMYTNNNIWLVFHQSFGNLSVHMKQSSRLKPMTSWFRGIGFLESCWLYEFQ